MPSPDPSWTLVDVQWSGVPMDGGTLVGTIEALPSVSRFKIADKLVIVNHPFVATITANSAVLSLPASDDPDVEPVGWTWTITEKIQGRPDVSYVIEVPISEVSTGIDLSDYAPVSESVGMPVSLVTRDEINDINALFATKPDRASLAAVAFSGSASDITTGTLPRTVMPALSAVAYSGSASDITTGTLPSSVLPPLTTGSGTSLVTSQAAMLALSVSAGYIAIRTDFSPAQEYYLTTTPASTLSNWTQVNLAGISVINGHGGSSVVLTKADIALDQVDNYSAENLPLSSAAVSALAGKQAAITAGNTAQYYRGDKTFQTLNKTAVFLDQVDNTSDTSKVASGPIAVALSGKESTLVAGTTSQYYRGDKSWQTLNKAAVGLSTVDNTSDTAKVASGPIAVALAAKAPLASPTFTGSVTVPSTGSSDADTIAASKDYVDNLYSNVATYTRRISSTVNKLSTASSTTLFTDTDLNFAIDVSESWWLQYVLEFFQPSGADAAAAGGNGVDLKIKLLVPSGTTVRWSALFDWNAPQGSNTTTPRGSLSDATTTLIFPTNDGTKGIMFGARVIGGSTAGNVNFQWAPNASVAAQSGSPNVLTRLAYSHVEGKQVN